MKPSNIFSAPALRRTTGGATVDAAHQNNSTQQTAPGASGSRPRPAGGLTGLLARQRLKKGAEQPLGSSEEQGQNTGKQRSTKDTRARFGFRADRDVNILNLFSRKTTPSSDPSRKYTLTPTETVAPPFPRRNEATDDVNRQSAGASAANPALAESADDEIRPAIDPGAASPGSAATGPAAGHNIASAAAAQTHTGQVADVTALPSLVAPGELPHLEAIKNHIRSAMLEPGRTVAKLDDGQIELASVSISQICGRDKSRAMAAAQSLVGYDMRTMSTSQQRHIDHAPATDAFNALRHLAGAQHVGAQTAANLLSGAIPGQPSSQQMRLFSIAADALDPRHQALQPHTLIEVAQGVQSKIQSKNVDARSALPTAAQLLDAGVDKQAVKQRIPALGLLALRKQMTEPTSPLSMQECAFLSAVRNQLTDDTPGSTLAFGETSVGKLGRWAKHASTGAGDGMQNRLKRAGARIMHSSPFYAVAKAGAFGSNENAIRTRRQTKAAAAELAKLSLALARHEFAEKSLEQRAQEFSQAALMEHWTQRPLLQLQSVASLNPEQIDAVVQQAVEMAEAGADPLFERAVRDWVGGQHLTGDYLKSVHAQVSHDIQLAFDDDRPVPHEERHDARNSDPADEQWHSSLDVSFAKRNSDPADEQWYSTLDVSPANQNDSATNGDESPASGDLRRRLRDLDAMVERATGSPDRADPNLQTAPPWPSRSRDPQWKEQIQQRRERPLDTVLEAIEKFELGSAVEYAGGHGGTATDPGAIVAGGLNMGLGFLPAGVAAKLGPSGSVAREAVFVAELPTSGGSIFMGSGRKLRADISAGGSAGVGLSHLGIKGFPELTLGADVGTLGHDSRELRGVYLRLPRNGDVPNAAPGVGGDNVVAARMAEITRRAHALVEAGTGNVLLHLMAEFPELSVSVCQKREQNLRKSNFESRVAGKAGLIEQKVNGSPISVPLVGGSVAATHKPKISQQAKPVGGSLVVDLAGGGHEVSAAADATAGTLANNFLPPAASKRKTFFRRGKNDTDVVMVLDGKHMPLTYHTKVVQALSGKHGLRSDIEQNKDELVQGALSVDPVIKSRVQPMPEQTQEADASSSPAYQQKAAQIDRYVEDKPWDTRSSAVVFGFARKEKLEQWDQLAAMEKLTSSFPASKRSHERCTQIYQESIHDEASYRRTFIINMTGQLAARQYGVPLPITGTTTQQAASTTIDDLI
jgi:hypothetical protein